VSSNPVRINITANGKAKSGNGNARVINTSTRKVSFPGKSNRDNAYPAGAPIRIDKTMVTVATMTEFASASIMPSKPAKNFRLAKSISGTKDFGKLFTVSGEDNVFTSKK
jgi:hypothetical protein